MFKDIETTQQVIQLEFDFGPKRDLYDSLSVSESHH
ncbi:unnamed protein product, partial [Arabidopsis halleri]